MRFLVAMLLITIFAGCASPSEAVAGDPLPMLAAWDAAEAEAAKHGIAILAGVTGWEYAHGAVADVDRRPLGASQRAVADDAVGDGQSAVWRFRYFYNDTLQTRDVLVADSGVILSAVNEDRSGNASFAPRDPVQRPAIDSPQLAAEAFESLQAMPGANQSVVLLVGGSPCGPYAMVALYDDINGDPLVPIFLDATKGGVVGVGLMVVCGGPPGEAVSLPFTVDAMGGDDGSFSLFYAHDSIAFLVQTEGLAIPGQRGTAVVTGPDGQQVDVPFTTGPGANARIDVTPAPAGAWSVSVRLDVGVQASGTLLGCSAGILFGSEPNAAC